MVFSIKHNSFKIGTVFPIFPFCFPTHLSENKVPQSFSWSPLPSNEKQGILWTNHQPITDPTQWCIGQTAMHAHSCQFSLSRDFMLQNIKETGKAGLYWNTTYLLSHTLSSDWMHHILWLYLFIFPGFSSTFIPFGHKQETCYIRFATNSYF